MNFRLYLNLSEHRMTRPRANETVSAVFKKQNKQTKTKHQTCMNWEKKLETGGRHTEPIY